MRALGRHSRIGVLLAVVVILLISGLAIDLGFTKPAIQDLENLAIQRSQLLNRRAQANEKNLSYQDLTAYFGVEDLKDIVATQPESDPLSYLGQIIAEKNLTRLDLVAGEVSQTKTLQRTQFSLRLQGGFSSILDFIRTLEQGERLVCVDALVIEKVFDSKKLESKLRISIYDPIVKRES